MGWNAGGTINGEPAGKQNFGIGKSCLGCLGSVIVVPVFAFVLAAPAAFHQGGRWTPLGRWHGVGRLRDSAGKQYGMYLQFESYPDLDFRNEATSCCTMSGYAEMCTASGARYRFDINGRLSGAWLRTDGHRVELALSESGHPKMARQFQLSGVWRGSELVLDDDKSMFVHFLPGGNLPPNAFTTGPVPEKHAKVTVSWGELGDLEPICASIGGSGRN